MGNDAWSYETDSKRLRRIAQNPKSVLGALNVTQVSKTRQPREPFKSRDSSPRTAGGLNPMGWEDQRLHPLRPFPPDPGERHPPQRSGTEESGDEEENRQTGDSVRETDRDSQRAPDRAGSTGIERIMEGIE